MKSKPSKRILATILAFCVCISSFSISTMIVNAQSTPTPGVVIKTSQPNSRAAFVMPTNTLNGYVAQSGSTGTLNPVNGSTSWTTVALETTGISSYSNSISPIVYAITYNYFNAYVDLITNHYLYYDLNTTGAFAIKLTINGKLINISLCITDPTHKYTAEGAGVDNAYYGVAASFKGRLDLAPILAADGITATANSTLSLVQFGGIFGGKLTVNSLAIDDQFGTVSGGKPDYSYTYPLTNAEWQVQNSSSTYGDVGSSGAWTSLSADSTGVTIGRNNVSGATNYVYARQKTGVNVRVSDTPYLQYTVNAQSGCQWGIKMWISTTNPAYPWQQISIVGDTAGTGSEVTGTVDLRALFADLVTSAYWSASLSSQMTINPELIYMNPYIIDSTNTKSVKFENVSFTDAPTNVTRGWNADFSDYAGFTNASTGLPVPSASGTLADGSTYSFASGALSVNEPVASGNTVIFKKTIKNVDLSSASILNYNVTRIKTNWDIKVTNVKTGGTVTVSNFWAGTSATGPGSLNLITAAATQTGCLQTWHGVVDLTIQIVTIWNSTITFNSIQLGNDPTNIQSVKQVFGTTNNHGASFSSLNLPSTVEVFYNDFSNASPAVVWNPSSYNPNAFGDQVITGSFASGALTSLGIKNTNNIPVYAVVNSGVAGQSDNTTLTGISPNTKVSQFKTNNPVMTGTSLNINDINNAALTDNSNIGTGTTINVVLDGSSASTYTAIVYGDVNGDGNIDLTDLVAIRDHILGFNTLSGLSKSAGELYGESDVTLNDLVGIMAYVSGTGNINQNH